MNHLLPIEIWNPTTKYFWDVFLWNKIFAYLDNEIDLLIVSRVNKLFLTILMANNFWIYHVHDNYKYAKFNIYNSISDFVNIFCEMQNFLKKKMWSFSNECTFCTIQNYNFSSDISQNLPDFKSTEKIEQNDYCIVINGDGNIKSWKRENQILIYNKFLPDNNPNKYITLIKDDKYWGKSEDWDFKLYGNYVWYIHETYNSGNITVTFYAINIITDKIHKIYTYDDEYNTIWQVCGHWKFNDACPGLTIRKNFKY